MREQLSDQVGAGGLTPMSSITLKTKENHLPSSKSVLLKRAVGEVVIYLLNLFMGTFNLTFHR